MAWENESRMDILDVGINEVNSDEVVVPLSVKYKKYVPVKALSHTSPYKIHKYFARRPWNVFSELIETFTEKGEVVLDPFCGGGVTIYEGLSAGRKVIGFDLNPLSIFVVSNMVKQLENPSKFQQVYHECLQYLDNLYQGEQYFEVQNKTFKMEWYECTFKIVCNHCGAEILLANSAKIANGVYKCSNEKCQSKHSKREGVEPKNCNRIGQTYLYKVGFDSEGTKGVQQINNAGFAAINKHIAELKKQVKKLKIKIQVDQIPRNWDRQFEDQLFQKGIHSFQDFFTERNLLILNLLLHKINSYKDQLAARDFELFRICFSNTLKDTSIMSFTNDQWQSGRPAAWSKHAYWIPSQFCEVNIVKAFKASYNRVLASANFNHEKDVDGRVVENFTDLKSESPSAMMLVNSSIAQSDLPENSVDAIITDPPYGSNVQYLELSHFWYPWNKDLYKHGPDFSLEAVSNRKKNFEGAKSMYTYEQNLNAVFARCYQVLKPGKNMVLTFNNKDVSAWLSLLFSIFKSGFTLEPSGLFFQDGVKNYKQTAHTRFEGSPYGDFIYNFKKAAPEHCLKIYHSQSAFQEELHFKFTQWMSGELDNKNHTILEMFLDVIPLIEGFSKSFLMNNEHNLYTFFKKDYFKNLF